MRYPDSLPRWQYAAAWIALAVCMAAPCFGQSMDSDSIPAIQADSSLDCAAVYRTEAKAAKRDHGRPFAQWHNTPDSWWECRRRELSREAGRELSSGEAFGMALDMTQRDRCESGADVCGTLTLEIRRKPW